jgi:ATP-dependent helicase HepA
MQTFMTGQRWISETEPELGLGLVTGTEHRRVQVTFPASGETRLYASDRAPLRRARFAPGDTVQGPDGLSLLIESVEEQQGLLTYVGQGHRLAEARPDRHPALRQTGTAPARGSGGTVADI